MANFPSSIFRLPPSSPPSSGKVEVEGIADGKKLCAANNLLISLPDDLLLKILLNLSAQDIYYAASRVCRRLYYHTIRSEEFVNLHLRQQTEDYGLFFRFVHTPTRTDQIRNNQRSYQLTVFVSMKQGRVTVSDYYACKSRFKSSCNGLITQYNKWKPFFGVVVGNPVTGRAFRLPSIPENAKFIHCCVGYAEASKAYKVALVYNDEGWEGHVRWAMLTVGLDRSWRHIATDHWIVSPLSQLVATEGFIHFIFQGTILTLNVETEGMTKTQAPVYPVDPPMYIDRWYLSTGKSLTVLVKVEDGVYRVLEMVCGDNNYYYWREWEQQIVLGSEIQYLFCIQPVGWLQQMEVLVFDGLPQSGPCVAFYVVIATGEIGRITPKSSSKEGVNIEEFYEIIDPVPHINTLVELDRNTLVELEEYY